MDDTLHSPLRVNLRWGTIIAGALVSLLFFTILMTLGVGVGGQAATRLIQGNDSASAVGIGTVIWTSLSFILSLFLGVFIVSRTQLFTARGHGATQGLVIASLFFGLLLSSIGSMIGTAGRVAGQAAGTAVGAAGDLTKSPGVQDALQSAMQGLHLKSPPDQVLRGLVSRLTSGNSTSARDYLAAQAGISPTDAQARIDRVGSQFQTTVKDAGTQVATAASTASYGLCIALVLGAISAAAGGAVGARRRIEAEEVAELPRTRAA